MAVTGVFDRPTAQTPRDYPATKTYKSRDVHLADRLRGVVWLSTEPQTAVAAFFDVLVVLEDQSIFFKTFSRQSERSSWWAWFYESTNEKLGGLVPLQIAGTSWKRDSWRRQLRVNSRHVRHYHEWGCFTQNRVSVHSSAHAREGGARALSQLVKTAETDISCKIRQNSVVWPSKFLNGSKFSSLGILNISGGGKENLDCCSGQKNWEQPTRPDGRDLFPIHANQKLDAAVTLHVICLFDRSSRSIHSLPKQSHTTRFSLWFRSWHIWVSGVSTHPVYFVQWLYTVIMGR